VTCRDLVGFLGAYLDGELADDVGRRFDAHLAACAECAAYVHAYAETVRVAQGAFADRDAPVPADVPEDLVQAILAARGRR